MELKSGDWVKLGKVIYHVISRRWDYDENEEYYLVQGFEPSPCGILGCLEGDGGAAINFKRAMKEGELIQLLPLVERYCEGCKEETTFLI